MILEVDCTDEDGEEIGQEKNEVKSSTQGCYISYQEI